MRKNEVVHFVLGIIGVAGIVIAAGISPGLAFCIPHGNRHKTKPKNKSIDQTVRRLLNRGLIAREFTNTGIRLVLTDRGYAEFLENEFRLQNMRQKRWDGRWRLLIFDIPEKRRSTRNRVWKKLRQLGFRRLQDSVWAYPFSCQIILELLQIRYSVRHDAMILEVTRTYPDHPLKQIFRLSAQ